MGDQRFNNHSNGRRNTASRPAGEGKPHEGRRPVPGRRDGKGGKPAAAPKGKTVTAQQYQQRSYTEAELRSVSEDLMEEARKLHD